MGEFMDEMQARYLLGHARRHPVAVLEIGDQVLKSTDPIDNRIRSIVYRSMALAARVSGTANESTALAEHSLEQSESSGDQRLIVEALMTLAGCLMFQGENQAAIEALDRTWGMASGHLEAELKFQMGTVRARMGESAEARRLYSKALPIFISAGDDESVAMTLHNQGMLDLYEGDLDQALNEFAQARDIELRLGMESAAAAAEHNIGVATAFKGDLPKALEILDRSEAQHLAFAESPAEVQVSRVEVLLTAGLFREAFDLAESVSSELERIGLAEDQAEAILVTAEAARLAGDSAAAVKFATHAAAMFENQGRESWRLNAEQVVLGARLDLGEVSSDDVPKARQLGEQLDNSGLYEAAFNARLTTSLIAIRCGLTVDALSELTKIAARTTGPVQHRLSAALAKALILELEGKPAEAERVARAGMRMLDEYQAVLGASDVRAGVEQHASQLGELGLRLSTATDDPRQILEWMEMSRARSLRLRPVHHEIGSPIEQDLSTLRQLQSALRHASDDRRSELQTRKSRVEESIRDRSRRRPGIGPTIDASVDQALGRLDDLLLVEFGVVDDELWRVSATADAIDARVVASLSQVRQQVEWHRFGMRLLARGRGSRESTAQSLEVVDDLLLGDLAIPRSGVVIVPIPLLYAFAWPALPSLTDVPTTVAPSLAIWAQRSRMDETPHRSVAAIAGPDLDHGEREAGAIATLYSEPRQLPEPRPDVDSVLRSIEGVDVAHFASHATYQRESPMFSSIRLEDGDLHVYDLQQLRDPPQLVVLSACDSGFSSSYPGEELLGLTSSMLALGTRSIVASVGPVPDTDATVRLMVEFHRLVLAGNRPSMALHQAQRLLREMPGGDVVADSFICVGGG